CFTIPAVPAEQCLADVVVAERGHLALVLFRLGHDCLTGGTGALWKRAGFGIDPDSVAHFAPALSMSPERWMRPAVSMELMIASYCVNVQPAAINEA